jgi:hypothetical protein
MCILYIYNNYKFHYEILESIIVKYNEILKIENNTNNRIYLGILSSDDSFVRYIKGKYKDIILGTPKKYDYCISCTEYDQTYDIIKKNSNKHFYISHNVSSRLKLLSNVYYLTTLVSENVITTNILPFNKIKIKTNIPIYIIQGNITSDRRDYSLLLKILSETYDYDFKIKMIGRGNDIPDILKPYRHKILLKNNLNFIDYHKEFLDGYCILPLTTKQTHPQYYTNKLTSTINYASGYKLKCLIDKDLQDIYKLENVEIFKNKNDIVAAFKRTLVDFYQKKNK